MKKLFATLLVFLMALSLMAGCTAPASVADSTDTSTTTSSDQGTASENPDREQLTFWFWGAATNYQEHMKKVLSDWYNGSQDKYELVLEFRNTVDADIPVGLAAGEGPDIVYCSGPSYTATYAQEGLVVDMSAYAEQYGWKDRILGVMYDACTVDGKLYSLPGGMLVGGLYYNKDVFSANNLTVPTDMDSLIAALDGAKAAGLYPLAAGNKGWKPCNDHFSSMIMGAYLPSSVMYDALTGKIDFTDPRIISAVQTTADWYAQGYLAGEDYVNLDSSEVMLTLGDGRAAMVAAPSLYFQWLDPAASDKVGFTAMPNTYTDHSVYNVSMACNFAINANSKAPDECAKILDYMMTSEFVLAMNQEWPAYWTLPLKDISTLDISSLSGVSKTCFAAVQAAIPEIDAGYFYYHPATFFPAATVTAYEDIDTVWQGVLSAEDFCKAVATELKNDIANKLVCPLAIPAE